MGFSAHRVLCLGLLLVPAAAFAQVPTAQSTAQAPAPGGGAAPAGSGSAAPEKPKGNTEGFTFSDKPARRAAAPVRVVRRGGPVATLPGFEETSDGGSRLFVALTQSVPVEERKANGVITYVLKGAHINRYNNANALVTVHFNTPVSRARLVPQGNDLLFVVELRANAAPTFKMNENTDHSAMLTIDFAKGDFSNVPASDTPPAQPAQQPKKLGKKTPPQPAPQQTTPVQQQPAQQPAQTGPTP